MANYYKARIPLEVLSEAFGHTKSFPEGLMVPEVFKCEFHVLSDGSAEIFFDVRTDYDGTTKLLPPEGPSYAVHLHIPKERVLDCVSHSGVMDVSPHGRVEAEVGVVAEISEDFIKNILFEHSRELIMSYLCLFTIGGSAN